MPHPPRLGPFLLSIPSSQQLVYFFSFLAAGAVFLTLAFLLFLPVIILSPSKFALSFTLGCLCIMAGFIQLRGWKQQLQHMMSADRLPYSLGGCGLWGDQRQHLLRTCSLGGTSMLLPHMQRTTCPGWPGTATGHDGATSAALLC